MNLIDIGAFINDNGLAVFLLLCVGWAIYKVYVDVLKPYLQKKLNNTADNQDSLQDNVQSGYFQLVKENSRQLEESRKANDRIVKQLEVLNVTNQQISETNRRLVESYDRRICTLEVSTEEIVKTVDKINTKVDVILK